MARHRRHAPLRVLLNNALVGVLLKSSDGAVEFRYEAEWLGREHAIPVSLSLPLREEAFRGAPVFAVFENLLPDSEVLRRRVAERVGAQGTDVYSLLAEIGSDCVGALQFVPLDLPVPEGAQIEGEPVSSREIGAILNNLSQAPLGLSPNQEFRISVAGVQDKTALLLHEGQWLRPTGATPTTHLLKPQIGRLPNGIDLSQSVENEYFCLKLLAACGLPAAAAEVRRFAGTKALVVERFDRRLTETGRLLRLPQEDCCQALSIPPSRKYQNEGGPGMVEILTLLKGSDRPQEDQKTFLKAQILFWLIGATDGHAKNFSIFLGPRGRFYLAPLYDVLTVQPAFAARQILRKQIKLAMSVGDGRHYQIAYIKRRHFLQTVQRAGLPATLASDALEEIVGVAESALDTVQSRLPRDFPSAIPDAVRQGMQTRMTAG